MSEKTQKPAPHGACSRCGRELTRREARDRSHSCVPAAAFPALGDGSADRERIRATLRRVLPQGSTIWTIKTHETRSGRISVLPQAFLACPDCDVPTQGTFWGKAFIASRRYILGREFCEKLGYRWDNEHMGWLGNYGEDASGAIVAALSMAAYDRPDAYSLGRTA